MRSPAVATSGRGVLGALLPALLLLAVGCSSDAGGEAATSMPTATASPASGGGASPAAGDAALYGPNLVEAERFDPVLESACSRALGAEVEPDDEEVVVVYFSCEGPEGPIAPAAAVERELPAGADGPRKALELLFDGPTDAEREAGYISLFGPETRDLGFSFTTAGDVGVVDLSKRFGDVEFMFVSLNDVAQIVSTVGRFEGIERVSILVEGEPLCRVVEDCV